MADSIAMDYNFFQNLIWAILAVITWAFKKSLDKTNEYLNTICNSFNVVQNTLNTISSNLVLSLFQQSQRQTQEIHVYPTKIDDIVKKERSESIDRIEIEEKELEGGDIG